MAGVHDVLSVRRGARELALVAAKERLVRPECVAEIAPLSS